MSTPVLTPPPPATIHEADRATGPSGAVVRGAEIAFDAAVARRVAGLDVVVCGDDLATNRDLAQRIEAAVGPYLRMAPHRRSAGRRALPHFQQQDPDHPGHTLYETPNLRAARRQP